MKIQIRIANDNDEKQWRDMWLNYNEFYGAEVSASIADSTWARIIDSTSPIGAFVAIYNSETIGFLNYVIHSNCWK